MIFVHPCLQTENYKHDLFWLFYYESYGTVMLLYLPWPWSLAAYFKNYGSVLPSSGQEKEFHHFVFLLFFLVAHPNPNLNTSDWIINWLLDCSFFIDQPCFSVLSLHQPLKSIPSHLTELETHHYSEQWTHLFLLRSKTLCVFSEICRVNRFKPGLMLEHMVVHK